MGYTHYWDCPTVPTPEQWALFTKAVRRLFALAEESGISLAGPMGTGRPIVTKDYISFNGRDPWGHETCRISRDVAVDDFCKTNRKRYDPVVVAVLVLAQALLPGFKWSSDGDPEDHAEGILLAHSASAQVGPQRPIDNG